MLSYNTVLEMTYRQPQYFAITLCHFSTANSPDLSVYVTVIDLNSTGTQQGSGNRCGSLVCATA